MGISLVVLLILSMVDVVLNKVFINSPELFKGGGHIADIFYNFSMAYIVSYIFFAVVSLPQRKSQRIMREYVFNRVNEIIQSRNIVLWSMADVVFPNNNVAQLSRELVVQVCGKINPRDMSNNAHLGKTLTWAELLVSHVEHSIVDADKIKSYAIFTDVDVLQSVNSLLDSNYFDIAIKILKNIDSLEYFNEETLSFLANALCDYVDETDYLEQMYLRYAKPSLLMRLRDALG